jgi:hypothetical protein
MGRRFLAGRAHGAAVYRAGMRMIWTGRVGSAAARYADHAPAAAVCCNACRACATTNALALVAGVGMASAYGAARLARRLTGRLPEFEAPGAEPARHGAAASGR